MAEFLGKAGDAALFRNRSRNYQNVWNENRQLMCPRKASGVFDCPLDPSFHEWMFKSTGYTEGKWTTASTEADY